MQLIRYKQDIGPIVLVLSLVFIQIGVFFFVDNLYALLVVAALLLIPQGSATAVNHNHQHLGIFHSNLLNRWFEVLLFFNTGCGPFAWVLHHTLGHHMNYLDEDGDTCPWKRKDGSTMNAFEYTFFNTLKIYPEIFRVGKKHPAILKKFKLWSIVCLSVLALFLYIDAVKTLILFIIPMTIQNYFC